MKFINIFKSTPWKNFSKGYKVGVIVGVCNICVALLVILVMLVLIFSQSIFKVVDEQYINDFNRLSDKWEKDIVVGEISHLCGLADDDISKVKCVVDFGCNTFTYVEHDFFFNHIRKNPSSVVENGGVCRDYAIFYMSIFNNLNITNEFNIPYDYHINNKLFIDNRTYIVDDCLFYEDLK